MTGIASVESRFEFRSQKKRDIRDFLHARDACSSACFIVDLTFGLTYNKLCLTNIREKAGTYFVPWSSIL